jgi:hypothetical protein
MPQRYFISKSHPSINGYLYENSVKNVKILGVDTVVFNDSNDSLVEQVLFLTNLPNTVTTVLYINKNLDPLLLMVAAGIDAVVYDDESFLSEKDDLDFVVEAGGTLGTEVKSSSADIQTLENFAAKLSNSNEAEVSRLLSSDGWIATLNGAVESLKTAIIRTEDSSTRVVEFVDNIQAHIQSLERHNEETGREIAKLRERVQSLNVKSVAPQQTGSSLLSYGTYDVPNIIKNVGYVRCYGDVRFLTTFFLMYQNFITSGKRVNVKTNMLIIKPQLTNYTMRYSNFCKIAPVDAQLLDTDVTNIFVTFEPQKKVLDTFFNSGAGAFIVLDFMQANEALLRGHMVKMFSACASAKMYNTIPNKTPIGRTFFTMDGVRNTDCFVIPYIEGFADMDDNAKKGAYYKSCKGLYERFTQILLG